MVIYSLTNQMQIKFSSRKKKTKFGLASSSLIRALSVGIFTLGGEFRAIDLTSSYLFYKFITVVSTILLIHMHGRWFILFFPPL